ncbi:MULTISPECIES: hypothetical protein [unclassified Psychrobacillus]|uniref:hypothetical protein n=1 Tax=unclassified Psychrobacillus TaxID=2636677 RepID=UPI0030F4D512
MNSVGTRISGFLNIKTAELEAVRVLFEQFPDDGVYLFRKYGEVISHRKHPFLNIMNSATNEEEGLSPHEFQDLLSSLLHEELLRQPFMRHWKDIYTIQIKPRNRSSYPSLFAIYINEEEMVQFRPMDKMFGIRDKIVLWNELLIQVEKESLHYQEKNILAEDKVVKFQRLIDRPAGEIKSLKDIWTILTKREKIRHFAQKSVNRELTFLEEDKEYYEKKVDFMVKRYAERIELLEIVGELASFFEQLDYRLETSRSSLY